MQETTWDLLWDDRIINWFYPGQRLLVKQLLFYEVCVIYSQGVTAKEKMRSVYLWHWFFLIKDFLPFLSFCNNFQWIKQVVNCEYRLFEDLPMSQIIRHNRKGRAIYYQALLRTPDAPNKKSHDPLEVEGIISFLWIVIGYQ